MSRRGEEESTRNQRRAEQGRGTGYLLEESRGQQGAAGAERTGWGLPVACCQ